MKAPSGQAYVVTGYINDQNLVEKVETRVDHPILGDLLVEAEYFGYQDLGGVKVPERIMQKRAGLQTFEATITAATANPANLTELLTPPAAGWRPGWRWRRRRRRRLPSRRRAWPTASSASPADTCHSPSTWATTSS